jgi:probable tautomerase spr0921
MANCGKIEEIKYLVEDAIMPFVRIDLFEGRTLEQKKALAKEVTEAVVRNTGAPQSAVHVIINDMPEGTYFPQGEMRTK